MSKGICPGFLLIMIILISATSHAKYNISPSISIMGKYDDNIFLDSENEEHDFITTISPKIGINYSSGKAISFTLNYGLNFRFYDHHSYLNDEDIKDAQEITFESLIKPSKILFIEVSDSYQRVEIDVRRSSAIDNDHLNMTSKNTFMASPYIKVPLTETITGTAGYSYTNVWHKDKELNSSAATPIDSDAHSVFLTLYKKFSPRIGGALEYEYYAYRPDLSETVSSGKVQRYDRHNVSVLVDYQIMQAVNVNGEMGNMWLAYQSDHNRQEFFWNIGVDNIIRITKETSVSLNYGIEFQDSATAGLQRTQSLNLSFVTGKILRLELTQYFHESESLTFDRQDRLVGAAFELSRPLTKKIMLSINGNVGKNEFSPEGVDTIKYSIGSILSYRLNRRMETSIGYRYNQQKASEAISTEDLDVRDYRNNIAWLQAELNF